MTQNIAIAPTDQKNIVDEIQKKLSIPYFDQTNNQDIDFWVIIENDKIGIKQADDKKPFFIDFISSKSLYRSERVSKKNELLIRAIGMKLSDSPVIVDATAGLGKDSFIIATHGFKVIMLERNPILYLLLENALMRAKQHAPSELRYIFNNMQLVHTDAIDWLKKEHADLVYLDPMFPAKQKSAAVKKDMQLLQNLLQNEKDNKDLLPVALSCATKRVVVKRPRLAESLAAMQPDFAIEGKTNRFDVYLTSK